MNQKGLANIVLIVILTGTVGYLAFNQKNSISTFVPSPTPSPTPTPIPSPRPSPASSSTTISRNPPIIDHFTCSDYCPGPHEKYIVKIYQGVTDPEECKKIGGRPDTYYGWGEFHICIAE